MLRGHCVTRQRLCPERLPSGTLGIHAASQSPLRAPGRAWGSNCPGHPQGPFLPPPHGTWAEGLHPQPPWLPRGAWPPPQPVGESGCGGGGWKPARSACTVPHHLAHCVHSSGPGCIPAGTAPGAPARRPFSGGTGGGEALAVPPALQKSSLLLSAHWQQPVHQQGSEGPMRMLGDNSPPALHAHLPLSPRYQAPAVSPSSSQPPHHSGSS